MSFERHLALKKLWTFRSYWDVFYWYALYLIKSEPRLLSPGLHARPRVCFTSMCLVPLTSSGKQSGYSGSVKNVDKVGLDKKLVEQLNKAKKITRNTGCPLESKLRSKCRAFFRIENARTGAFYFTQFALSGILKWASAQTLSHITRADTHTPSPFSHPSRCDPPLSHSPPALSRKIFASVSHFVPPFSLRSLFFDLQCLALNFCYFIIKRTPSNFDVILKNRLILGFFTPLVLLLQPDEQSVWITILRKVHGGLLRP